MSRGGLRGPALLAAGSLLALGSLTSGVAPAASLVPRPVDVRAEDTPGLSTPTPTAPTPTATSDAGTAALPAQVRISTVSPLLMTPRGTLTMTGTVTNTGAAPLEVVYARLRLVPSPLRTRTELDAWLQGTDLRSGTPLSDLFDRPVGPVAAGGRAPITLTVPASALGLGAAPFGAYGLAVEVRALLPGGRERVGLLRTTLQWQPGEPGAPVGYRPQQVAWLVPFTGLPVGEDGAAATDAEVAAAVAPGSRLRRLLDGASGQDVSWAIDPALLQRLASVAAPAAVDDGTANPTVTQTVTPTPTLTVTPTATPTPTPTVTPTATATPSSAATSTATTAPAANPVVSPAVGPTGDPTGDPTSDPTRSESATSPADVPAEPVGSSPREVAATFLADLRRAASGRAVVELPYGDPDLAAITSTGRTDLVRATTQAIGAGIIEEVLGVTPAVGVGWPADGWASEEQLGVMRAGGLRDVVLDERSRRPVDALPYTPDARADLSSGITGWLTDPALSALVASAHGTDVRRVQLALAQTAAATSERPALSRRLLVVAPRDADVDPAALRTLIAATSTAPWVDVVPVTDLRRPMASGDGLTTDGLPRRAAPVPADVSGAQLSSAHVAAVRRMRGILAALGEVVSSPTALTTELQRSSLELLSTAWRGHPDELRQRRAVVAGSVTALNDELQVLPSSVNLLASTGRLQITVLDGLPQDVSGARLQVTSDNPRLRVREEVVKVPDLAAGTRAQVQVPVQAIASSVVRLNTQLLTPSGRPIGRREVTVTVHAQPTGSWALWVLGGVAAVVVLVGLVRALRRPRRQQALTEQPAGEQRTTEQPSTEQPETEQPTSGQPIVESP